MGQITIDIPQHFDVHLRVVDNEAVAELLTNVRDLIRRANKIDPVQVVGIWADRSVSADDIADHIRGSWKRKLFHG